MIQALYMHCLMVCMKAVLLLCFLQGVAMIQHGLAGSTVVLMHLFLQKDVVFLTSTHSCACVDTG